MNVKRAEDRVRAEFEEMPGLTLTVRQASRLFGLEHDVCHVIVERLIESEFLRRTQNGAITRVAA